MYYILYVCIIYANEIKRIKNIVGTCIGGTQG